DVVEQPRVGGRRGGLHDDRLVLGEGRRRGEAEGHERGDGEGAEGTNHDRHKLLSFGFDVIERGAASVRRRCRLPGTARPRGSTGYRKTPPPRAVRAIVRGAGR